MINIVTEVTSHRGAYGNTRAGVTSIDVERAADELLRAGERPTIERVRNKLGTGSPNTINPLLDVWWQKLAARLDNGPHALHRLPESVAHLTEGLWLQALDDGRRRALIELQSGARANASEAQQLEIRAHVLSLREGELESRLRDRQQVNDRLETQLGDLTILLRKEQLTIESQARRIAVLEGELSARTQSVSAQSRRKVAAKLTRRAKRPGNRKLQKLSIQKVLKGRNGKLTRKRNTR